MFWSLCSTSAFEIDLYNSRGEPGWVQQTPTRCMLTTWWSLPVDIKTSNLDFFKSVHSQSKTNVNPRPSCLLSVDISTLNISETKKKLP